MTLVRLPEIPRIIRIQHPDALVNRANDLVRAFSDALLARPWLGGVMLEDVALTYGARNDVSHSLGRKVRGWYAMRVRTRPCAFMAYQAGAAQAFASGAVTTVTLDTEAYDDGGDFASSTFTAPEAGRYDLSCVQGIAGGNDGMSLVLLLLGSVIGALQGVLLAQGAAVSPAAQAVVNGVQLAAGETVVMRMSQNSGGPLNAKTGIDNARFEGRMVGSPQPYEDSLTTADSTKFLSLRVDRSCTATLWVF